MLLEMRGQFMPAQTDVWAHVYFCSVHVLLKAFCDLLSRMGKENKSTVLLRSYHYSKSTVDALPFFP